MGFWGTLGGCMVCSLVKRVFFVYCVIQSAVDRAPRPCLYTRMRLRLWLLKVTKVNQFMLATFSKSVIFRRHVIRFLRFGENTFLGDNIFVFIVCLRQIFLDTTKWGRGTKKLGGTCPRIPRPVARAWSFARKWRSLLQEWSILHCRFNSLVRFDWGNYVTFHLAAQISIAELPLEFTT